MAGSPDCCSTSSPWAGGLFFVLLRSTARCRSFALQRARRGQWLAIEVGVLWTFCRHERSCRSSRIWHPTDYRQVATPVDQPSEQTLLARPRTPGGDDGVLGRLLCLVWLRRPPDYDSDL